MIWECGLILKRFYLDLPGGRPAAEVSVSPLKVHTSYEPKVASRGCYERQEDGNTGEHDTARMQVRVQVLNADKTCLGRAGS